MTVWLAVSSIRGEIKTDNAKSTEYRVANSQSSFILAHCSKMANSIGIPIEDSQEDGNQHSRL